MVEALVDVAQRPRTYDRMRRLGRLKAEAYRASEVFPRLARDLLADLAAQGTHRAALPSSH
jgi:hypothetical protein